MQEASFQTHQHKYLPFQEGHILLLSYRCFRLLLVTRSGSIESHAHAITVVGIVIVTIAVVVHIHEVSGIAGIIYRI